MKILLINDQALPRGGAEVNLHFLRDGLRKRGHDARLFSSTAGLQNGDAPPDYSCFGTTTRFRTLLQTANPFAYWRLRRALKEFQPDAVYVKIFLTQLSPLILPLLKKIPSVHHVCWYRVICPKGTKFLPDQTVCRVPSGTNCYRKGCLPLRDWGPLMIQNKLYRRWKGNFDLVLAYSRTVQQRLEEEGYTNVETLTYGFSPAAAGCAPAADPLIAFAGRLVPEKGAAVMLKAFASVVQTVPKARLLIAGEGPEENNLKKLAADLHLSGRVSFLGFVPKEKLEPLMAQAWVQAVPSLWEEPFGNVAVEAMMRGTAVVASRSGGLAEIVDDGETGLLVSPGSVEELACALLSLLNDAALRNRLAARAKESAAEMYNAERYISRIESIFQKLTNKKEAPV